MRASGGLCSPFAAASTPAATVSAAGSCVAHAAEEFAYCNPLATEGASTFGLFGGGSIAVRGGEPREPDLGEVHEDLPASGQGQGGEELPADRAGLVPRRQRRRDREHLEHGHPRPDDGAEPRLRRLLRRREHRASRSGSRASRARTTPLGTTRNPRRDAARDEARAPSRRARDAEPLRDDGGGLPRLGLPARDRYEAGPGVPRRIVVDWESMPGASTRYAGQFDLGQTATHEAGHWLNLEHMFFGGCNAKGDFVDDTPAQRSRRAAAPRARTRAASRVSTRSTTTWTTRTTPATTEFTEGQSQRMRDAWLFWRA